MREERFSPAANAAAAEKIRLDRQRWIGERGTKEALQAWLGPSCPYSQHSRGRIVDLEPT